MKITNQKEFFNKSYKKWAENIPEERMNIAKKTVKLLGISKNDSVIDVAAGTGILYSILRGKELKNYVAVDISEKMLEELKKIFPEVQTRCLDFDKKVEFDEKFDYVIIFNSIPHFENMDVVFKNAKELLNEGGCFSIIHARTREGLKKHHRKIGYNHGREPIPSNTNLNELSRKYNFKYVVIKDEEFFYFSCVKNNEL
ncbi:class I SAM-dependent DNA methyltransferase [Clostridium ganghwense]|uniref:Class I SAM-dependent methyltransferase n=1 Tax=Clostridium ganghwense TaxID=312089 RepID=A0ABT4CQ18_9CLOT|nr:class I SAM-dependent methyltransferase [Clostridium ganghwense]MCY6371152.1 class I SAM-dependent methyltransferase [Clostridium ganghwense]